MDCQDCDGTGYISSEEYPGLGSIKCNHCDGTGLEHPNTDTNADHYIFCVVYQDGDCEFNFLAAFTTKEKADEYAKRNVWSHLNPYVSRQPVY